MSQPVTLSYAPPFNGNVTTYATLTARQLRLGLLAIGKTLADVDAAIAALPPQQRDAARIEWEYSTTYDRRHPLIATLAGALGLSQPQLDAAWSAAASL